MTRDLEPVGGVGESPRELLPRHDARLIVVLIACGLFALAWVVLA